jgi:hypothetical protein
MKRFAGIVLALFLLLAVTVPALAEPNIADELREEYRPGMFSDVDETAWYGTEGQGVIRRVWELGLMVGTGDGCFRPEGQLRLGETVKLALLLHCLCLGLEPDVPETEPWYRGYMQRAGELGLLEPGEYPDPGAYATRAQLAHLLSRAVPDTFLPHINAIFAIPDVSRDGLTDVPYSADILRLYRAGILLGDAGDHSFRPMDGISRAEAAAAAVRVAQPDARQRLELLPLSGASAPIPQAALTGSDRRSLSLGYHTWEEFFAFAGDETAKESADLWLSADVDESRGYPIYGEEGSLIRAEYGDFTVTYLLADRQPMGVYILELDTSRAGVRDSLGVTPGISLRSLQERLGELPMERDPEDPTLCICAPEGVPAVFIYRLAWDERVKSVCLRCRDA